MGGFYESKSVQRSETCLRCGVSCAICCSTKSHRLAKSVTHRFVQEADHYPGVLRDVVPRPRRQVVLIDLQRTREIDPACAKPLLLFGCSFETFSSAYSTRVQTDPLRPCKTLLFVNAVCRGGLLGKQKRLLNFFFSVRHDLH